MSNLRWYQTGWGVALFGLAGLIIVVIGVFAVAVGRFWWQIRQGQGEELAQKFTKVAVADQATAEMRAKIELTDEPNWGSATAPVTIVEFVDFKCPICRSEEPVIQQVLRTYAGKIRLIMRDFPVESIHPGAGHLAAIAQCAYEQKLYWPVHNYLFANQDSLSENLTGDELAGIVSANNLDATKLQTCLDSFSVQTKVNRDFADGVGLQVLGTPTFFVNGTQIQGEIPFETWQKILDTLLKQAQ